MAFKKTLVQRLFNISRITNPPLTSCCVSSPCTVVKTAALNHQQTPNKLSQDPGDEGISRRYLHRLSVETSHELRFLPSGEKLMERFRGMDIARHKIRLYGLRPPAAELSAEGRLTVGDAKKILRLSQIERVKLRLRQIETGHVSYLKFLQICAKECSNTDQDYMEFAQILDESGCVIVLGNIVFLRPEQVVKAIQSLIPMPSAHNSSDSRMKELQELEKQKVAIDRTAELQVRRELWFGFGYLVIQTAAFLRLTFWDLSWDVMEPICFHVASLYFMGGYVFFLRTSKEPSFEGFFQCRFSAKQKRLMEVQNFDVERYNELKNGCHSNSLAPQESVVSFTSSDDGGDAMSI